VVALDGGRGVTSVSSSPEGIPSRKALHVGATFIFGDSSRPRMNQSLKDAEDEASASH
jgi:hypothetical protein